MAAPDRYYEAYGLARDPFQTDCPVDDLYASQSQQQRLNLLRHLIQSSDLLLLVQGEQGSGKTTMLRRLASDVADSWHLCRIQARPDMGPGQLLAELVQCYGARVGATDPHSLQTVLRQRLKGLTDADLLPVLCVDDAHFLPEDTLQAVLALHEPNIIDGVHSRLARLVLFCEPLIEEREAFVSLEHDKPDTVHRMEPVALEQGEARSFIDHCLETAGMSGQAPFIESDIQEMFWRSEGVPGRLGALARSQLIERLGPGKPASGGLANFSRLIVALVALAVLGGIWLQLDRESPDETAQPDTLWQPSAQDVASMDLDIPIQDPVTEPVQADVTQPMEAPAGNQEYVSDPVTEPLTSVVEEITPDEPEPPVAETVQTATDPGQRVDTKPDTASAPAQEPPTEPAPEPEKTPVDTETLPADADHWLASRAAERYTVQLIALSQESAIDAFIAKHKLSGPVDRFTLTRNNRDLHVLVWGDFKDRGEAEQAIAKLPTAIRQTKPWPRSFGSIQHSLGR